ncbi:MAG TPA: putative toxin-antitoxin system toxin component, PIN family [Pyrinomonadaceae bacterium]|nr:putative toxin-antitoxin system toxin component, PIN family [Pyrinomonadaceae bacterium]
MNDPLRVILDCSVFWRAFFSPLGTSRACTNLILEGVVAHFISTEILVEVRDVLTRPETLRMFPSVTTDDAESFISHIVDQTTFVGRVPRAFQLPRNQKDEPYIDLAALVDADFIVTTDKDMLDLMTGIDVESKQFRQSFRGLKIVKPEEFLRIVAAIEISLKP